MLSENDYQLAANILGCEVSIIKAITKVEAPRGAYDASGRITLLFEPFEFYKQLKKKGYNDDQLKKIKSDHPTLISSYWNQSLYGKYSEQWNKLQGAANINAEAAYNSASYGLFQIMGYHAKSLGFDEVFDFYYYMAKSEKNQLLAFCKYIEKFDLSRYLVNKDFKNFARLYNGPGYKETNYPKKLRNAYDEFRH